VAVPRPIHATEWSGTTVDTVETIGAAHCTAMNASDARRRGGVPNSRVRGIKGQRRRFRWRPLKREWRCTKERSGGDYSKRTYYFHDRYSFTTRPRLFHNRKLSRRIFDVSQSAVVRTGIRVLLVFWDSLFSSFSTAVSE
jgi:hypothetical protein